MSLVSTVSSAFCVRQHVGYNEEAWSSVHVAPKLAGACPVCLAHFQDLWSLFCSISSKNVRITKNLGNKNSRLFVSKYKLMLSLLVNWKKNTVLYHFTRVFFGICYFGAF